MLRSVIGLTLMVCGAAASSLALGQGMIVRSDVNSYGLRLRTGLPVASGAFQGLSFGWAEAGSSGYDKGAIIFETLDAHGRGALHLALKSSEDDNDVTVADAKVTVDYQGRLGVGVSSPTRELDVNGSVRLASRDNAPSDPVGGDIYFDDSDALCVFAGGVWNKLAGTGSCK